MKHVNMAFLFCVITLISCGEKKPQKGIANIKLSLDDKTIYFQYFDGTKGSIYMVNVGDSVPKKIIADSFNVSYCFPKVTNNNDKKILFKGTCFNNDTTTIFMFDGDGSNIKRIFSDIGIYDFYYNSASGEIVYNKYDTVANYSPVASRAAHGYDLYSYSIKEKQIKRLTSFHSYNMNEIEEYKDDSVMFSNFDKVFGIYSVSLHNPSKLHIIVENNELNGYVYWYSNPIYVKRKNMVLFQNSYFNIFKVTNGKVEQIYFSDGKQISSFCVYNTQDRILFTMEDDTNIYSINFDGTDKRIIKVNLR